MYSKGQILRKNTFALKIFQSELFLNFKYFQLKFTPLLHLINDGAVQTFFKII